MAEVLLVSKPVSAPWNDSSKNLVRDLATHLDARHRAVVMGRVGGARELGPARALPVYPAHAGGYAPALRENARVLAHLLMSRSPLWHFFFAPNPRSSRVAALAAGLRRRATLQTVCSAPREDVPLAQVLFADRVVVLSRHTEARFLREGIAPARLRRIAPCIAPLAPPTEDERQQARRDLGLPSERAVVVYPGDLEFSRGARLSLEVQASMSPGARPLLVMACRAKTPRAAQVQQALIGLAEQLGLGDSVRWLGETPHIHRLLGASDVVSLPAETLYAKMDLPLVAIEAMALGRPVLLARGSAAEELAEQGGALAVAPERAALGAVLTRWLADPSERAALGQRARAVAVQNHSAGSMAAAYASLYDELLPATRG